MSYAYSREVHKCESHILSLIMKPKLFFSLQYLKDFWFLFFPAWIPMLFLSSLVSLNYFLSRAAAVKGVFVVYYIFMYMRRLLCLPLILYFRALRFTFEWRPSKRCGRTRAELWYYWWISHDPMGSTSTPYCNLLTHKHGSCTGRINGGDRTCWGLYVAKHRTSGKLLPKTKDDNQEPH
jgi:hypothetical protein